MTANNITPPSILILSAPPPAGVGEAVGMVVVAGVSVVVVVGGSVVEGVGVVEDLPNSVQKPGREKSTGHTDKSSSRLSLSANRNSNSFPTQHPPTFIKF